uniref:TNFR-Cys domain-containing protein n=1 Tax=Sarcophilus harrisii TaxID=9305 RepID=A0A7N4PJI8_SARHA
MTDRQRHPWRPVTLLWLLAAQMPPASLQPCGKFSYSVEGKCCSYCKPGFEMASRCTGSRDTGCRPCHEGLFNEGFSNEFCQPCTQCNVGSGSRVLKNCTRSSDTVCQCTPGTQPAQFLKRGVECAPCPPGHFSLGENTMCKPWTNCEATGRRTQRAGSSRADARCEEARTSGPHPSPATPARTPAASPPPTVPSRLTTQRLGVLSTLPPPQPDKPWCKDAPWRPPSPPQALQAGGEGQSPRRPVLLWALLCLIPSPGILVFKTGTLLFGSSLLPRPPGPDLWPSKGIASTLLEGTKSSLPSHLFLQGSLPGKPRGSGVQGRGLRAGAAAASIPGPSLAASFSIIFLVLFLLLVFGLILLILGIYLSRRDKRQLPAIWKPTGPYSFRMPIQEEHQYSLAKV